MAGLGSLNDKKVTLFFFLTRLRKTCPEIWILFIGRNQFIQCAVLRFRWILYLGCPWRSLHRCWTTLQRAASSSVNKRKNLYVSACTGFQHAAALKIKTMLIRHRSTKCRSLDGTFYHTKGEFACFQKTSLTKRDSIVLLVPEKITWWKEICFRSRN